MALPTVQDPLATWPGWATLDLAREDELAVQGSGATRVQSLAEPLWTLRAQSKSLIPSVYRTWKAKISALENGALAFYGYDLSSRYPIQYPNGSWPTGGSFNGVTSTLLSVNANNKLVAIANLPAAFQFRAGDLFSFVSSGTRALHQFVEDVIADGSGQTPQGEVRPHVRAGFSLGGNVAVKQPICVMAVNPGSVRTSVGIDGRGTIAFDAVQIFDAG